MPEIISGLTRKERLGIITIAVILVVIFFLPHAVSRNNTKQINADTAWISSMKRLEQKDSSSDNQYERKYYDDNSSAYQYDRSTHNYSNKTKGELFDFDPNTLSTEGWQKLGLRDKTIHIIQNYLSKGGHFKNAEGLQKIMVYFQTSLRELRLT